MSGKIACILVVVLVFLLSTRPFSYHLGGKKVILVWSTFKEEFFREELLFCPVYIFTEQNEVICSTQRELILKKISKKIPYNFFLIWAIVEIINHTYEIYAEIISIKYLHVYLINGHWSWSVIRMASKKWIKGLLLGRRWLRVTSNECMNRVKTRKRRENTTSLDIPGCSLFCGDWFPVSVCIFRCKPASVGCHWRKFWRQKSLLFGLLSNLFLCLPLTKMKTESLYY